jgi:hypothetical protein
VGRHLHIEPSGLAYQPRQQASTKKKKKNSWMQASLEKSTHIAIQKKGYRIKCPKDKSVLS